MKARGGCLSCQPPLGRLFGQSRLAPSRLGNLQVRGLDKRPVRVALDPLWWMPGPMTRRHPWAPPALTCFAAHGGGAESSTTLLLWPNHIRSPACLSS